MEGFLACSYVSLEWVVLCVEVLCVKVLLVKVGPEVQRLSTSANCKVPMARVGTPWVTQYKCWYLLVSLHIV